MSTIMEEGSQIMFRAMYFVTLMLELPVGGENFAEAAEIAKKKSVLSLVKVRPGTEVIDHQVQLSSVSDMSVNGEM